MMKEKTSVQLGLKAAPWKVFLLKKYASHYGFTLGESFSHAVNCLMETSVTKDMMKRWATEYRKVKSREEDEVD